MVMKRTTAADKLNQERSPNVMVLSEAGIGKTHQLQTFPPKESVFINIEAGDTSIDYTQWDADLIFDVVNSSEEYVYDASNAPKKPDGNPDESMFGRRVMHPFLMACGVVSLCYGRPTDNYGPEFGADAFEFYKQHLGDPADFADRKYLLVDSVTQLDDQCDKFIEHDPMMRSRVYSEKTGKLDNWAVIREKKRLMGNITKMMQHVPNKSLVLLAIIDRKVNDGVPSLKPQMASGTYDLISGVVDLVACIVKEPSKTTGKMERYLITLDTMHKGVVYPNKKRGNPIDDIININEKPGLYGVIKTIQESLKGSPKPHISVAPKEEAQ